MINEIMNVAGLALSAAASCLNSISLGKNAKKIAELSDRVTSLEKRDLIMEGCFVGFGAAALTADIINKRKQNKLKKRIDLLESTVEVLQGSCVKQSDLKASTDAIISAINK